MLRSSRNGHTLMQAEQVSSAFGYEKAWQEDSLGSLALACAVSPCSAYERGNAGPEHRDARMVRGLGTEALPAVGAFFIPLLHEGNVREQNSSVSAE